MNLSKRDLLYEAGAPLSDMYFPDACIVSYLSIAPGGGRKTAVAIIGNEGLVAGDSLFSGIAAFDSAVQVAGAAHALSADLLKEDLGSCAVLNDLILRHTNALLIQIAQTALCNKFHSLQQRISRWLLLAQDRSKTNYVATRGSFARIMGTNSASIIWVTDTMLKEGLITDNRGLISIRDRSRLVSTACHCHETIAAAYSSLPRHAPL